jgi:hypothetical protein
MRVQGVISGQGGGGGVRGENGRPSRKTLHADLSSVEGFRRRIECTKRLCLLSALAALASEKGNGLKKPGVAL